MTRPEMVCPFSKKLCIQCAQFRGRHYYLCFSAKHRGCSLGVAREARQMAKPQFKALTEQRPTVSVGQKCLKNIEDSL